MAIHVMSDIETFGKGNDALIVSVGGVKFDKTGILDRFHVGIDPEDAERFGLKIDASTVMYWLDPKRDQARKELLELPKVDLYSALDGFKLWVEQTPLDDRGSLWGKGATFDNVRIKNAFDAVGIDYPFSYRQDECYRTLMNRCQDVPYEQLGTAHSAIADAESQALHLIAICEKYGFEL